MTSAVRHPVVMDASAVVAMYIERDEVGSWVEATMYHRNPIAPELMPFEVANILRRYVVSGRLEADAGMSALSKLTELKVHLYHFSLLSKRIWELCDNVTAYDASYVALAEMMDAPLVTLDQRLTKAPGLRCELLTFNGTR